MSDVTLELTYHEVVILYQTLVDSIETYSKRGSAASVLVCGTLEGIQRKLVKR